MMQFNAMWMSFLQYIFITANKPDEKTKTNKVLVCL